MKKIFCVLLLLACTGVVFAQEKTEKKETAPGEKKNALSLDLFPLFKGFIAADSDSKASFFCAALAYERVIAPHYSFGVDLDLYPGKLDSVDYTYFGLAGTFRFYPMSENMEKFFMGASLGFNSQSIDGKSSAENGGFSGLLVGLKAGYKLFLKDNFFFEPSMAYVYSKTSALALFGASVTPLGWQAGLRIGFNF